VSRYLISLLAVTLLTPAAFAHTDITPSQAHAMILSDENVAVVDVRENSEFCGTVEHIENAANLPWISGELQARFGELQKDVDIIVVCASGARSNLAATFLDGQGFTNVHDMQGGMGAWAWSTEACGAVPVVVVRKQAQGSVVDWTPAFDQQDYDLLRGTVDDIADAGTTIDLGPTDCLRESSPFTYYADPETPESAYFYLARPTQGSWGDSSDDKRRTSASLSCEGGRD